MSNTIIRSGNWFIDQLNIFQAANSDAESIKKNFIIRKEEFETIINSIKNKKEKDPLQHELILGRRGSGKSTLLKRIEIEITENKTLNKKFIPINLAEEQAGIYRLFDLWEQVLYELKHQFHQKLAFKDYSEFKNDSDYTKYLYSEIHKLCNKHKKKVILLLDNFDRIVENFNDDGNLLRETLINYSDVQIIGGSTRMDEHFWRYDMPFYEFFRVHRLEALSSEEIKELLLHWSNSLEITELQSFIENNPGKLENVRILTDGLPRTLQFFIQMVLQKAELKSYDYLKKIMDGVSPLFQERLNSLTAPLRKTVLEMAFIWEACSTKQLVEKVRMESKLVSAYLKTLIDKGIVEKIGTDNKNHLYRISERFFNLWIIITQGNPEQKRKAKWLSVYLENFYNEEDFKRICKEHLEQLKGNKLSWENAVFFSKGLSQSKYISTDDRDELIELTENLKDRKIKDNLISLPRKFKEILEEIQKDIDNKNYDVALKKAEEIENEEDGIKFYLIGFIYQLSNKFSNSEKNYLKSIEKGYEISYNNLAILYSNNARDELAEKYFKLAIIKNIDDSLFNIAYFYEKTEKKELAERYYLKSIDLGNNQALLNLGNLYLNEKKYDLAEKYLFKSKELGDKNALLNIGYLYEKTNKNELAEKYYLEAYNCNDSKAVNFLANFYNKADNFKKAEKYYLMSLKNGFKDLYNNLAVLYNKFGKEDLAEKYYLKAIEMDNKIAIYNIGRLYQLQGKKDLAEKYYLKGIDNLISDSFSNLAILYYDDNKNKEKVLELLQKSANILNLIIAEIWNGIFNNLEERIINEFKKRNLEDLEDFMQELLIHQQKNLLYKIFINEEIGKELQEKYMVLYYVVQILTNNNDKNLELRIPPELKSTIEKVLGKIKEKEIFYGYKKA